MFIQQGKTNWVMIIAIALVAGVIGDGLIVYINDTTKQTESLSQAVELKKTETTQKNPNTPGATKANSSSDFNLVFKYGIGGKNVLDTFENKFTKDMIAAPSITVDFKLTPAEMESIRQKINELDLLNKESKVGDMNVGMTPCSNYYLKLQDGAVAKEIAWGREVSWDNCSGEISIAYGQFSDFMINLIESKKEFKDLPEAQGGYM
jgi:hypothetical protein